MSEVEVTRDGAVMIVCLNRPERRNAINRAAADALYEIWSAFDADESARVGILTGGDDIFCAGADLYEIDSLAENVEDEKAPLGCTRMFMSKPIIAAVAGYCVAGGLELACWCDLRIADETAIFGCFERRFGVPLVDGGTQRLPQIVGLGRALELILTGRPLDAIEAHRMGLVNEVVPRGEHLKRALEIAHLLAQFPQMGMLNDRRAVYEGLGKPLAEGVKIEARLGAETIKSADMREGIEAYQKGKGRGGSFG